MKRRTSALALAALTLILITGLAAAGSGAANPRSFHHAYGPKAHKGSTPAAFFGIDPQDTLSNTDYAKMASNGVRVLRTGLYWQRVQPTDGLSYDWSSFDPFVELSAEHGITVLPYLYGTPSWVATGFDHETCTTCSKYAPRSSAALSAWKTFATAAAQRYGPTGEFWSEHPDLPKKPIRDWQIWNEQNSKNFYLPKPSPKDYAKALSNASQGLRSVDSKAEVILGGMFGLPGNGASKAIPASHFVRDLLKVGGAKKRFDGVALHPYSKTMKSIEEQVTVMRKQLVNSHYSDAELWITETGAASGGPKSPLNLGSKKAQAKRVSDTYKLFETNRKKWHVKLVAWFAWQDSHASDSFCFFCAKSGLVTESGTAKPSLGAYKRVAKN
jgi:hypothetical protein